MLTNIRVLIAACQDLNLNFEFLHPTQNLVRVTINDRPYFFVNYDTPFNFQSTARIFKDKTYQYQLLEPKINLPKSISFLSPFCDPKYKEYLKYLDIESIAQEIDRTLAMPVVIKPNFGSAGKNVFLCQDIEQIRRSLETIFNLNSKDYDYVAVAQEYIEIVDEYRAVFFQNKLLLLYEKNKAEATFSGNLSPLHWSGAKAVHITDKNLFSEIENFVRPIFTELPLNYAGADIAIDRQGKFWLIELNSHPNYNIFIRDNGDKPIVDMFKTMLKSLRDQG